MFKNKKIIFLSLLILVLFYLFLLFKVFNHYPKKINLQYEKNFFGVTYSKKYAEEIGLDWREAYIDILDELNVKQVRIPVYWNDIEKEPGIFDFNEYNFLIEEGEKRDVEFILNFGMRVARWPECHFPSWLDIQNKKNLQEKTISMIDAVLYNFEKYDSIKYLQVENEPLLNSFGICPKSDYNFLKKEVEFVRTKSDKPIIITATGELSFWKKEASLADFFGTTMYRVVHNKYLSYIKYPFPDWFYPLKANLVNINKEKSFIIELQAEPWISKEDIANIHNTEYQKSFNLQQFKANAQFAINTGFNKAYLWGVEWWYFKHKLGFNSDYWNFAKTLFK